MDILCYILAFLVLFFLPVSTFWIIALFIFFLVIGILNDDSLDPDKFVKLEDMDEIDKDKDYIIKID